MSETENTKAVILTQADDQKIFLDLNVSTDTTAIKSFEKGAELSIASFDYATGIAVFLALCATGLAYWYGKKSFRLTEMSFKTVMEQIKSSEKLMLESNKQLIKEQNLILISQLKISNKFKELSDFREFVANYYYWGMKVNNESISNIHEYYLLNCDDKRIKLKESVRIRVDELNALISKLMVYLDYEKEKHNLVRNNLFKVMKTSFDVYASIGTNFENSKQKINIFGESFGLTQGNLNTLIIEEINSLYEEKAA